MRSSVFLVELGAVIVGLAVLARLAGRFGFSPIPLYLLAGLAFGEGGVLPLVTAERFIETGAEIGVILLLLMLGLEYSGEELTETLRSAPRAGLVDLLENATPGFAAGVVLGWGVLPSVLLAGITYISSSGVVAKVIADLGWIGNREVPVVLSLLVIEDLAMAVFLPVVAVLLVGVGAAQAAVIVGVALVTVRVFLFVAVRFGDSLSRVIFSRSDEALLLTMFGLTLVVAGVAERLQISAAVGAFLVGIAVSGPAAARAQSLLSPLRDLFGAAFFVFFSLEIDPGTIPPVIVPALLLAAAGVATKAFTGWWAARGVGIGRRGRRRAGAVLVARGEFSIAIAALGLSAGVRQDLGPLTAAYVLTLALLAPILARIASPPVRRGSVPIRGPGPEERPAGGTMAAERPRDVPGGE
ncbi:MAG TPA: cation:proton antiporter [Actinomycetota bacterium]|nr:cation:proton antiporter [Actinomycetota bacterium]